MWCGAAFGGGSLLAIVGVLGLVALAMASTVESSVQLILFVLPVLVRLGSLMGRFLHLTFTPQALELLGATAFAVHSVTEGDSLTWHEGLLLKPII